MKSSEQMSSSRRIMVLVTSFSFFKSFTPIISYWVPYMMKVKGLTNLQITQQVLPTYTYAMLVCTLIAAPACKFVSSKVIIVAGTFANLLSEVLMRIGGTTMVFIIMEVASAVQAASSMIFQAYLFIIVTEENFQRVTGFTSASGCAALVLSAELAQILVLCGISYTTLLYITMAAHIASCVISFMLPAAEDKDQNQDLMLNFFSKNRGFWSVIKATWKDEGLQLLSIWWVFALAGIQLSLNYSLTLFAAIDPASTGNGHVVAIATALAVVMSLVSVYLKRVLTRLGGLVYIVGSIFYGAQCFGIAFTRTLWIAYALFIIMVGFERLLVCFLYAQCGSLVKNDQYALMFSLNYALAQAAQAAIQAVIEVGGRDIYALYIILGSFFMVLGVLFTVPYGILCIKRATFEIASMVESEPKPIKVDSVHQPLLAVQESV